MFIQQQQQKQKQQQKTVILQGRDARFGDAML